MLIDTGPVVSGLVHRFDVSERWQGLLGARLIGASWSDHETGDGVQPWAVTLEFDIGELVVALGEVIDGRPSYLPDSLVVTANRRLALDYRPPAALTPAWTSGCET